MLNQPELEQKRDKLPELPECHVMAQAMNIHTEGVGKVVDWYVHPNFLKLALPMKDMLGQGLKTPFVTRKAKYLILHFDSGVLLCHNKFTGYWDTKNKPWSFNYLEYDRNPEQESKDIRLRIHCENDSLQFHDARCLGFLKWFPDETYTQAHELVNMGPEVLFTSTLDEHFAREWLVADFQQNLKRSAQPIKLFLLDQKRQAGVGNIYACESLFRVGIHPERHANTLSFDDAEKLHRTIRNLLDDAINHDVKYDEYIKVFRQKECPLGHPIERLIQANRGTYFCSVCQT